MLERIRIWASCVSTGSIKAALSWRLRRRWWQIWMYKQRWDRFRIGGPVADPYSLIYVSPEQIRSVTSPRFKMDLPEHETYILDGDWDRTVADAELGFLAEIDGDPGTRECVPLERYLFYQSVENHIRDGVAWDETQFYDWVTTSDDFPDDFLYADSDVRNWRFDQIDRIAASIREDGYLLQRECQSNDVAQSANEYVGKSESRWLFVDQVPPEHHEVMINIGRDGELILEDGRHRFAVARALGVEEIPVRVFVRHSLWQKKRAEVASVSERSEMSKETRECLSHPDMVGLY